MRSTCGKLRPQLLPQLSRKLKTWGDPRFAGYTNEPGWPDADQLLMTLTASTITPDPLANLRCDFNDGSTASYSFKSGGYWVMDVASGVNLQEPGVTAGDEIGIYVGNHAALTAVYIYSDRLYGSIPDLSANTALEIFYCYSNRLTGGIPDLSANTALERFYCSYNLLTGTIPDLSANTALERFYVYNNQLTGSIPDLSANTALEILRCYNNQLTGSIPDLSANTALELFLCYGNQLTDYPGGATLAFTSAIDFNASDNSLTETAVNNLLIDFDNGTSVAGTIDISGGTNAPPTGSGLTAKDNLIAKGWTVNTN